MKKATVATLGCKVNQIESESIIHQLIQRNYTIVDFNEQADLYIINTCTVTNRTDFKSRNMIRRALKAKSMNASVRIIVTGCYAQKERAEIMRLGDIDLIVDNHNKIDLDCWFGKADYEFISIEQVKNFNWHFIDTLHEKTRVFLKIQDGCDYHCSYCAVPYGRGKPRSMPYDDILKQANILIDRGYREIVLTGVNLGLYNDVEKRKHLADVIKAMDKIDKLSLLRISSLEPDLWSDELWKAIELSSKLCPHFHVPIQSGSDHTLTNMKRRYDSSKIRELVRTILGLKPDCAIGFDIICGFPGETEADFEATYSLVNDFPIAYLHIFGYSKRKKTPAALMPNQIDGITLKQRTDKMHELGIEKSKEYVRKLIDDKIPLKGIIEEIDACIGSALSDHFVRVYSSDSQIKKNKLAMGRAIAPYKDGVMIN